jgi:molybdopterin-synthase adenylyltransferase
LDFTAEQLERYSRNMVLAELGPAGQERIRNSKVLVLGAGGLGSPAALYLAAAGVGTLGIVDSDRVDLSNLQRQVLHDTRSVGEEKTLSAARRIAALNPEVRVEPIQERFGVRNALDLVRRFDFVIDGFDNFPSKFLLNDSCVIAGKPFCHAGVLGFRGQVLTVLPGKGGPCLRCILPEIPSPGENATCTQSGVLGAAAGILGAIQAAEALKVLCAIGEPLAGRLLTLDCLRMTFRTTRVSAAPLCPVCSGRPRISDLREENYR